MIFGYPVKNVSNEVIAVIGVTLNLEYTQQVFEKLNFPSGASFSLLDHQGIILVRNLNDPASEKLIGRRDTVEELFTKMTKGLDEGTYEAMGNDGNSRLVAYKRISLPHESEPYLYVRSSIPLTRPPRRQRLQCSGASQYLCCYFLSDCSWPGLSGSVS